MSTTTRPASMLPADAAPHAAASYVRSTPVDSDPSADEAPRRVRGEQAPVRTLTSYARRDVRNTMSRVQGW